MNVETQLEELLLATKVSNVLKLSQILGLDVRDATERAKISRYLNIVESHVRGEQV